MPQKAGRHLHAELRHEAEQVASLEERERGAKERRRAHREEQLRQPAELSCDEDLVDEDEAEDRRNEPGDEETQPSERDEHDGVARARETPAQHREHRRAASLRLVLGARREREDDARERLVELLSGDARRPARGIVQVDALLVVALDDEEVVEVPVTDERQLHLADLRRLLAKALRFEPVLARGFEDVACLAAVARHAAVFAQLRERHERVVVLEDDREARRATLRRFHLEARRRSDALRGDLQCCSASLCRSLRSRSVAVVQCGEDQRDRALRSGNDRPVANGCRS